MAERNCEQCGTANPDNHLHCSNCGQRLGEAPATKPPGGTPPPEDVAGTIKGYTDFLEKLTLNQVTVIKRCLFAASAVVIVYMGILGFGEYAAIKVKLESRVKDFLAAEGFQEDIKHHVIHENRTSLRKLEIDLRHDTAYMYIQLAGSFEVEGKTSVINDTCESQKRKYEATERSTAEGYQKGFVPRVALPLFKANINDCERRLQRAQSSVKSRLRLYRKANIALTDLVGEFEKDHKTEIGEFYAKSYFELGRLLYNYPIHDNAMRKDFRAAREHFKNAIDNYSQKIRLKYEPEARYYVAQISVLLYCNRAKLNRSQVQNDLQALHHILSEISLREKKLDEAGDNFTKRFEVPHLLDDNHTSKVKINLALYDLNRVRKEFDKVESGNPPPVCGKPETKRFQDIDYFEF